MRNTSRCYRSRWTCDFRERRQQKCMTICRYWIGQVVKEGLFDPDDVAKLAPPMLPRIHSRHCSCILKPRRHAFLGLCRSSVNHPQPQEIGAQAQSFLRLKVICCPTHKKVATIRSLDITPQTTSRCTTTQLRLQAHNVGHDCTRPPARALYQPRCY